MTLASVIAEAERRRVSAIHYAPEPGDLAEQFDAHNAEILFRELPPGGPDPFLVIRKDDVFQGAVSVAYLRSYLEPPFHRPADPEGLSPPYRGLFDLLDDTVFASLTRRQLVATSREIEDRARRTGRGTLHAGFQSPEAFRPQRAVYRRLCEETALDVHVYLEADASAPLADVPATVHAGDGGDDGEVGRYWFLAFDGGGEEGRACALVAEQRTEDTYYGVWTYDPELVARVLAAVPDR